MNRDRSSGEGWELLPVPTRRWWVVLLQAILPAVVLLFFVVGVLFLLTYVVESWRPCFFYEGVWLYGATLFPTCKPIGV